MLLVYMKAAEKDDPMVEQMAGETADYWAAH